MQAVLVYNYISHKRRIASPKSKQF